MKLSHFLEVSGWTKAAVARKLGISDPAVSKWDDIPEQHQAILSAVLVSDETEPKIVRKCHPRDLPDDELKAIIRTRIMERLILISVRHTVGRFPSLTKPSLSSTADPFQEVTTVDWRIDEKT